jgi:hypothetical protein
MTFRELRNKLVFFAAAFGCYYLFRHATSLGMILAILASIGSAIVCVVIVAVATDPFMD